MASIPGNEASRVGGSVAQALRNGRMLLRQDARMALSQAQTILRSDRINVPALYLASAAHSLLGEVNQAQSAQAAALKVSGRDRELQQIAALIGQERFDEAGTLARARLKEVPEDIVAKTLLAETAINTGLPDKAETLLSDVRARAPGFRPAETLWLRMLLAFGRLAEMRSILDGVLEKQPEDLTALKLQARVLADQQYYDDAAKLGEIILRLQPDHAQNWIGQGENLRFAGSKEEAKKAFRKALELNPGYGQAWWHLANIDVKDLTEEDLAAMRAALAEATDTEHKGNFEFAIAQYLDKQGHHEEAFRHYDAGNKLRHEAQPYDALELTRSTTRFLELTPAEAIPARASPAEDEKAPIFILGMPRSGSTLLERILGQHSNIEALGELPLIPNIVDRLSKDGPDVEKRIANLDRQELASRAQSYLERSRERMKTDATYFVDKLHMNWKHLPLILRMLPSAIVVDIRRNAMDCCWSNFKTLFARSHPAASDQKSLAQFYRDYVRMCDTLRERAPQRIHFMRYENLIEDFDGEMTRLFDHIGLDFEDACRDFHTSKAPVATASSEQVREPLNTKGMGAVEPYRQWLGDLEAKLGELARA